MTELLTAAQMRAIEQAAIASGEVTGLELMERAGRGVVEAILEWRPELATTAHRAVVLCGPGNNGGDGFVVARLLKERGWEVEVFLYGDEAKLPPDAAENCRRWREMGEIKDILETRTGHLLEGDNRKTRKWSTPPIQTWDDCVVIDAVFGVGLSRPVDERLREVFLDLNNFGAAGIVAVDIPSGLSSDSGLYIDFTEAELKATWEAIEFVNEVDLTVTFHRAKVGHYLQSGPSICGELSVVDIGMSYDDEWLFIDVSLSDMLERSIPPIRKTVHLVAQGMLESGLSTKSVLSHKYAHGHTLILSGGVGKGGAARLAARGALRIGAGLVTLGAPPSAIIENAAQLNAIMLRPVADADALAEILKDYRLNALCFGPGLGVGAHTLGLAAAALAAKRATVLDADVLTSFAEDPPKLFALLHEGCVLTPHMGEFARLFPDIAEKLNEPATEGPAYSKIDATREAAARAGCTILLKGSDTVIADPQGRAAINSAHYDRAAPWLATAGSGDVLAGMITGLLARGLGPMVAAETAAWLHVEAARKFGPGLIAEDLPEMLPAVFRDLGL